MIITSPNSTHYEYIEFFVKSNFSGYIFCEKPPVVSPDELLALKKMSDNFKQKILFDFNLRFSKLYELLTYKKYGQLLYLNIVNGHGLGYKSSYKNSWRNDKKINKLGIFKTVIIHYIDLLFNALGEINYDNVQLNINSPYGNTIDNCMYSARMKNETMVNIFVSYTMPYVNEVFLIFEDGLVKLTDKNISIYEPRDTFASNGNFTTPPLKANIHLETNFWDDSEKRIVEFFVDVMKKKETLPLKLFDKTMFATEYIMKYCSNIL